MKNSKGYTLIEVMVSMVLFGIIIILINGFITFFNRNEIIKQANIIIDSNIKFEKIINGELSVDELKSIFSSLEYSMVSDTSEDLVEYVIKVTNKKSDLIITEYKTTKILENE